MMKEFKIACTKCNRCACRRRKLLQYYKIILQSQIYDFYGFVIYPRLNEVNRRRLRDKIPIPFS